MCRKACFKFASDDSDFFGLSSKSGMRTINYALVCENKCNLMVRIQIQCRIQLQGTLVGKQMNVFMKESDNFQPLRKCILKCI